MRGKGKIGTTGRGIGSAYADKVARQGVRLGDYRCKDFLARKIQIMDTFYKPIFKHILNEELPSVDDVIEQLWQIEPLIAPLLCDSVTMINDFLGQDKRVLAEGAQGVMLDIDFGTYPYVTSSNPTTGGVCTGLGVPPQQVSNVLGVSKAYTTRVGEGPFPTELNNDLGEFIRQAGGEFGATTGRPRRCGWFDAPVLRRAIQVAGVDKIALTKLDVLDGLKEIEICTHYAGPNGEKIDRMPLDLNMLEQCTPVYEKFAGWNGNSTAECKVYEDLPQAAQAYVARLEELLGVDIPIVSVGARRKLTILRQPSFF
jgi:adenylosuccinate synthase